MSRGPVSVLAAGRMCGPYEIIREIGRGGMAVVYLARDPHGQQRAIKAMQFSGKLRAEQVDRFVREIQLLATIDHVHVVRFFESGSFDKKGLGSTIWVALEFLEGQTLRAIIRERGGRVDVEDVMRWGKHIADGVSAAHALRVVHRDLKPENVAIVHGMAKVFDFGIAKYRRWGVKSTHFKTRLGTVGYMAPEQLSGSDIDERVDVFALGVMLYELACGQHPFCPHEEGLSAAEAIARTLTIEPPRLDERMKGFPEDLAGIIDRALAKERNDRFATMIEMRDALDRALRRHRAARRPLHLGPIAGDWQVPPSLGEVPPTAAAPDARQYGGRVEATVMLPEMAPATRAAFQGTAAASGIAVTLAASPTPIPVSATDGGQSLSGSIPGVSVGGGLARSPSSPWLGRALMALAGAVTGSILCVMVLGSLAIVSSAKDAGVAAGPAEPAASAVQANAPSADSTGPRDIASAATPSSSTSSSSNPSSSARPPGPPASAVAATPSPSPAPSPAAPPRPHTTPSPAPPPQPSKRVPVFGSQPQF